jgi:hypothetical protein
MDNALLSLALYVVTVSLAFLYFGARMRQFDCSTLAVAVMAASAHDHGPGEVRRTQGAVTQLLSDATTMNSNSDGGGVFCKSSAGYAIRPAKTPS